MQSHRCFESNTSEFPHVHTFMLYSTNCVCNVYAPFYYHTNILCPLEPTPLPLSLWVYFSIWICASNISIPALDVCRHLSDVMYTASTSTSISTLLFHFKQHYITSLQSFPTFKSGESNSQQTYSFNSPASFYPAKENSNHLFLHCLQTFTPKRYGSPIDCLPQKSYACIAINKTITHVNSAK